MTIKTTPLFYLGSLSAFALITFDLYQPALPVIVKEFNASYALGQLTFSLYLFVFGLAQLFWGPIVDHFGRNKALATSLSIFFMATLACIFATNIYMLICARAIQAFSACCASIVSISSTRDCEDSTERARIISYISMIVSASPVFAPLIGSLMLIYFSWQADFVLMLLFAVYLFVCSRFFLYESPFFEYETKTLKIGSWLKVYKTILTHKKLWIAIINLTGGFTMLMIFIVNAAYLLMEKLHFSPLMFAILFGINGSTIIIGNYAGIKLREKYSLIWNIKLGSKLLALGAVLMCLFYLFFGLHLITLAPAVLISFSTNFTIAPVIALLLADYNQNTATVTALMNTTRMSLSAVFAGLVGTLLVSNLVFLPISLLIFSIICLISGHLFKENP